MSTDGVEAVFSLEKNDEKSALSLVADNLSLINIPLIVRDSESALKVLGGPVVFSHFLSEKAATVDCWLLPDEPTSRAISGDRNSTSMFLLRSTRKKSSHGNEEEISSSIVGHISSIYSFTNLADFSFTPIGMSRKEVEPVFLPSIARIAQAGRNEDLIQTRKLAWEAVKGGNDSTKQLMFPPPVHSYKNELVDRISRVLNLPPASFSKIDKVAGTYHCRLSASNSKVQDQYLFGANASSSLGGAVPGSSELNSEDDSALDEDREKKREAHAEQLRAKSAQYNQFSVMRAYHTFSEGNPVPTDPLPFPARYNNNSYIKPIQEAFNLRYGWSFTSLVLYLKNYQLQHKMEALLDVRVIRRLLPSVAYFVRHGSFRCCWFKLGFDPTKDPHYFLLQMCDVKLPDKYWCVLPKSIENQSIAVGGQVAEVPSSSTKSKPKKEKVDDEGDDEGKDDEKEGNADEEGDYDVDAERSAPAWMYVAGTLLVRRSMFQIIDFLMLNLLGCWESPEECMKPLGDFTSFYKYCEEHKEENSLVKKLGLQVAVFSPYHEHGVVVINDLVIQSVMQLVEDFDNMKPQSDYDDKVGWLRRATLEYVRRLAKLIVCAHLVRNTSKEVPALLHEMNQAQLATLKRVVVRYNPEKKKLLLRDTPKGSEGSMRTIGKRTRNHDVEEEEAGKDDDGDADEDMDGSIASPTRSKTPKSAKKKEKTPKVPKENPPDDSEGGAASSAKAAKPKSSKRDKKESMDAAVRLVAAFEKPIVSETPEASL
jgi:RNA polymerase III transcription factor (TF)IIIC subunit HTH domain/Tau95 Triple barrel domain